MQKQINSENNIDEYLDHLEHLSSKIADNISSGLFNEITKMDNERKVIIHKISSDAANLNNTRKNRLKLVWVNNNSLVKRLEDINQKKKKKYIKLKKTIKAYTKDIN